MENQNRDGCAFLWAVLTDIFTPYTFYFYSSIKRRQTSLFARQNYFPRRHLRFIWLHQGR